MKKIYYFLLLSCSLHSCIEPKAGYDYLAPGLWRGVLHLSSEPKPSLKDEIKRYEKDKTRPIFNLEDELPFFFEVKYEECNKIPYIEIMNGKEHIPIHEVYMGRNKNTAEDTILIDFTVFDSHIRGIVREGIIEGEWTVRSKNNYQIPFTARFGQNEQFNVLPASPKGNISGTWDCTFDLDQPSKYQAVGEFVQQGSELNGTFRTETGDYRYLHGIVNADKFYLSCFDGAHAYLFNGKFQGDSMLGSFKSGKSPESLWEGIRNDQATLRPATSLNKATGIPVNFNFLDTEGKTKTIHDYSAKIKVLQIMGTWCPNCYDETNFIKSYVKDHPELDIKIIALACERYKDTLSALKAIKTYKSKMNVPYDILLAATTNRNAEAIKQLPFLDSLISYPTMIILDKNNHIQKIHTGFDGPATSKYEEFKKEFNTIIQETNKL